MEFKIEDRHEKYLKLIVCGVFNKNGLIHAISETMNHPDYAHKHSYWDFTQATMSMSIYDLKEIVGIFRLYKPDTENFANRVAILISGELNNAILKIFIPMTKLLPFRFQVFTKEEDVMNFLLGK